MFRAAILALLAFDASAIKANSKTGLNLLKNAKLIEKGTAGRALNDEYNFLASTSLEYSGCESIFSNGGNNNNGGTTMIKSGIAVFTLKSSCTGSTTHYGKYAVEMGVFVDSYTENKMTEEQYACENFRESCDCDDADDADTCEETCFTNAGMTHCNQEEEFEVQRYVECSSK
jgi:hypothetical protein